MAITTHRELVAAITALAPSISTDGIFDQATSVHYRQNNPIEFSQSEARLRYGLIAQDMRGLRISDELAALSPDDFYAKLFQAME